jgi:dTDP-4-amino-4,6-dideoxygalactose transaminase|tara:strand:- start:7035 stop:8225 length:1191 start_codon:yes stop_codon:yes gene_type:complete
MFHRIPPVGNPISWSHPAPPPVLVTSEEQCLFFQSGTAALAQALVIAKSAFKTDNPEVIVPGYACPDIISAAVYAGVTPVLVDLEADRPYMSLPEIENAITDNTVAIIAINFLGIPERISAIRKSLGDSDIILIEDSAQWYPDTREEKTIPEPCISKYYNGDMVILSFGKGKPVSLMGGGAVLIKHPKMISLAEQINTTEKTNSQEQNNRTTITLKTQLLLIAYNTAISNYGYWLLELLPWIKLGETHYKPLDDIKLMDNNRLLLLSGNQQHYQQRPTTAQQTLKNMLANPALKLADLPEQCDTYQHQRLLRYPILLPSSNARNKALKALEHTGCGASPLYPSILPNIADVSGHIRTTSYLKNATNFASRLITLPTHRGVSKSTVSTIQEALQFSE